MDFRLTEDQLKLQEQVGEFSQGVVAPLARKLDRDGVFPVDLFKQVGEMGITAIPFSPEYGGLGLGTLDMVIALEQLARADQSLAVTTMVSVASGLIIQRFGTPEQKARFLPDIVSGKGLGALAGTEPHAGSDTQSFTTRAELKNGEWVVNGAKEFITNAGTEISSYALTLVVTSSPDDPRKTFSLLIVPTNTPGFVASKPYEKMGWRSSDTRPLYLEDCRVSQDLLMGQVGQGRFILHKGYQQARAFLSACSLGLAQACLDRSVEYAQERKAFGGSIGSLQLIQKIIADMAVKVDCARLLTYRASWMADQGMDNLKELSMAKYYATEIGTQCADAAIQVHGGFGFMDDCDVSRYYRDNRICTIGDGSSQIQTLLIARALGLDVRF